jgi:hypothetical protein
MNGTTMSVFVYAIQSPSGCVGVNGIVIGSPDDEQYKRYEASALTSTAD